jgi:hypothetical protein
VYFKLIKEGRVTEIKFDKQAEDTGYINFNEHRPVGSKTAKIQS